MGQMRIPRIASASRSTSAWVSGELLYDTNGNRVYYGDGASNGGILLATGNHGGVGISAIGSSLSSGTVVFSNSNGVSFGMNGATVTASVVAGAGGGIAASAAGNSVSAGTVVWSNANGISFGMAGSTITASHNALTAQTNQTIGAYAVGGTAGESSSTTLDARSVSITAAGIVSAGYSAGSVVLSATQSNQAVSAANGSVAFQTVSFSNANGISFETAAGPAIRASYTVPTVTNSSWTVSDSATSGTVARLAFTNLNGVTLSLSTGAAGLHTIVGSHNALTAQSTQPALGSVSVVGNTVGQTSAGSGTLVLAGGPNITLSGATAAGIMTISVSGGAGASPDGINRLAAGGVTAPLTATVVFSNSNGISFGLDGGGGSTVMTASHNGLTAQTNQTLGLYAVGNTTSESESSTFDARTISFRGEGIASVGYSNGSVIISVPSGGGAGYSAGASNLGNTLGSTGTVSNRLVLVGSRGITLSQSTGGASSASLSVLGPEALDYFHPWPYRVLRTGQQWGQGSMGVFPMSCPDITFDRLAMSVHFSAANNSTASFTISAWAGIYTKNASTLSLLTSWSTSQGITHSGTVSTSVNNNIRIMTMGATGSLGHSHYWLGMISSTSSSSNSGSISQMLVSQFGNQISGMLGVGSNGSVQPMLGWGFHATSQSSLPGSIAFSDLRGTNFVNAQPWDVHFANGTV